MSAFMPRKIFLSSTFEEKKKVNPKSTFYILFCEKKLKFRISLRFNK